MAPGGRNIFPPGGETPSIDSLSRGTGSLDIAVHTVWKESTCRTVGFISVHKVENLPRGPSLGECIFIGREKPRACGRRQNIGAIQSLGGQSPRCHLQTNVTGVFRLGRKNLRRGAQNG